MKSGLDQAPGAFPHLVVHDEIVIEAPAEAAEPASQWLRTAMLDAMGEVLRRVPVAVEVQCSRSWA